MEKVKVRDLVEELTSVDISERIDMKMDNFDSYTIKEIEDEIIPNIDEVIKKIKRIKEIKSMLNKVGINYGKEIKSFYIPHDKIEIKYRQHKNSIVVCVSDDNPKLKNMLDRYNAKYNHLFATIKALEKLKKDFNKKIDLYNSTIILP